MLAALQLVLQSVAAAAGPIALSDAAASFVCVLRSAQRTAVRAV